MDMMYATYDSTQPPKGKQKQAVHLDDIEFLSGCGDLEPLGLPRKPPHTTVC